MIKQLLEHLAVRPDGSGFWIGAEVNDEEEIFLKGQRTLVLEQLREQQLDAVGFYVCLPLVLEQEIRAAHSAVVHIETTAPTRFSPPRRVHRQTRIGEDPWSSYRALHPGVCASSKPRIRAVTIDLEQVGTVCFDWDRTTGEDKTRLLSALFSPKQIIGHDLATTCSWLFAETSARPTEIVDTMLLVQHLKPAALLRPFAWAAKADDPRSLISEKMLHRKNGNVSLSLEYVATCFKALGATTMRSHAAWSLSKLSAEHHSHCHLKIEQIKELWKECLPNGRLRDAFAGSTVRAATYTDYAQFTIELAEAHVRGVPFDMASAVRLKEGLILPKRTLVAGLIRNTDETDRVHSLITLKTCTGRSRSRHPALQNLPRCPKWRGLIKAREGHCILSVDYSSVELRIAAALAARAVRDIEQRGAEDDWWTRLISLGAKSQEGFAWPSYAAERNAAWYRMATLAAGHRVLGQGTQTMKKALQSGIDLHLVTAVDLARRSGRLTIAEDVLAALGAMSPEDRGQLKGELGSERQLAKACNFGLLYGMSPAGLHQYGIDSYGLEWSSLDAAAAQDAWFELYPEIRLWHLWTRYCCSREVYRKLKLWDPSQHCLQLPKYPARLFETTTLSGRPVVALDSLRRALNYQGQGSGADILARAVRKLPATIKRMLLLPVHDELVLEVPIREADAATASVEGAMLDAGREVLGPDIPVSLDTHTDHSWC
ncbi:DNA polymerase [Terriglobus sp.]|uniref:DNA polymerase n=1 Tax=Terriglobus sp. TaxID=1889013 RepID=UPI003B00EDD3